MLEKFGNKIEENAKDIAEFLRTDEFKAFAKAVGTNMAVMIVTRIGVAGLTSVFSHANNEIVTRFNLKSTLLPTKRVVDGEEIRTQYQTISGWIQKIKQS